MIDDAATLTHDPMAKTTSAIVQLLWVHGLESFTSHSFLFKIRGESMKRAVIAGLILLFSTTAANAETFDNESVIALSNANVEDAVLLAKIDSLPCSYKVGTDDIIRLKNSNVSDRVITAMVQRCVGSSRAQGTNENSGDPLVKRRPGIYLYSGSNEAAKLQNIRPNNAGGVRITGNGSIVFPFVARLSIAQPSAQTVSSSSPVFYFYFESADNKTGDFGTSESYAAQSPTEFSLVKFKAEKGQREMTIGKASAFNTSVGIDPKNTIPFVVEEAGDGIFKVQVSSPLKPGEYAFVIKAGSDRYRIYDFRVN